MPKEDKSKETLLELVSEKREAEEMAKMLIELDLDSEDVEKQLEEFQKTIVELKRLKLMERPAVPLSEIRNHNPYIQRIGDQYSHRIEYHGIEFVQTLEKTEKGYIYESRRPFEIVSVEFYND